MLLGSRYKSHNTSGAFWSCLRDLIPLHVRGVDILKGEMLTFNLSQDQTTSSQLLQNSKPVLFIAKSQINKFIERILWQSKRMSIIFYRVNNTANSVVKRVFYVIRRIKSIESVLVMKIFGSGSRKRHNKANAVFNLPIRRRNSCFANPIIKNASKFGFSGTNRSEIMQEFLFDATDNLWSCLLNY